MANQGRVIDRKDSPDQIHSPQFRYDKYYADRGCGGECVMSLECPYPQCVYDEGGREVVYTHTTIRRIEAIKPMLRMKMQPCDIADMLGISVRTVYRLLRKMKGERYGEQASPKTARL